MAHYPKLKNPYKVYTAYYNVEEGVLKIYENTLGTIIFSYDSDSNKLNLTSGNLFGDTDNSTPDKFYGVSSVISYGGFSGNLRTVLINPGLVEINDGITTPGSMSNGSLKLFLEIRVYN